MQTLSQKEVLVEATNLVSPNKQNVIRVLHVDDDPSIQEITKLMLLDLDSSFKIDQACCVDEGFSKLADGHYDVVVSDYEMPQKDGLQFLMELRKQKSDIPFILFTGKGREEVAIKALNNGADGYLNKQGSPETVYGELSHSIKLTVERYRAKEMLKERDSRFMKLAAQTPGMLFQFLRRPDGTYCIPFTSEGIREIFGCSPQEVKEDFSPIAKAIVPEDIEKVIQSIEYSAATLSLWQCEYRVQLPGQKIRWMWGQSAPEKLEDNSILWSGYNTNITERKNAEEKLRGTFEVLDRMGESIDAGLAVIGKDYRVVWANKQLMDLGVTPTKKCYQIFNRSETICPDCGVKKIFEQNVPLDVHEYKTVDSKGQTIWIELRVTPLKDKNGNVTAALELAVPIIERKKAEARLRDSEEKYRELFEGALDAIFLADAETGILIDCNRAASELVGKAKPEIVGQHQRILHPTHEIEGDATKAFKQHQKQDSVIEAQIITKTGTIKDVSIKSSHIEVSGRKVLQGVFRDITQSKIAQNALLVSEEKHRQTIQNANVGIIAYRPDGTITILNPRMQKMTGYTKKEIPNLNQWFTKLYPNEAKRQKIKDKWFKKLTEAGEVKEGQATITTKQGEQRIFLFDGFRLSSGDFIAFARDITDHVKAEEALNVAMDQLVSVNEKLNVVGSLTRHDVRNKLLAVNGYAYLLKKKHADQADIVEGLGKMEQAVKESMKIFDFAKMYEQLGVEELKYIDVEKIVNEAVTLFSCFTLKVANNCPGLMVLADSLLRQLFYNFMDNTRKYGKKTTTVRVHYETVASGDLQLIYEDNGVGISAENKLRLFSEGFSTGASTGFGLFLIKKMVDVYGWQIQEVGEPGKGVKFVLTIPRINQSGKENYQIVP